MNIHNWYAEILSVFSYSFNRVVNSSDVYGVKVSVDKEGNKVVTMFDKQEPDACVSWTFNNVDGLIAYTISRIEIDKAEVALTVPENIKALEATAEDLNWN